MHRRGGLRYDVLAGAVTKSMQSRLCQFVFLLTLTSAFAVKFQGFVSKAFLLFPFALLSVSHRAIVFEVFMSMNLIQNVFGHWNWFNLVDDNLYVGAVPLLPGDPPIISKKLGVNALLCTLEAQEMSFASLFGSNVPPELWRRLDIEFQHLPLSDTTPPSFELLSRGANYLNLHLSENRRVYVYCRSGCSRASLVVLAYFIKHRGMSAKDAFEKLARKRRINFRWGSKQSDNLVAYEKSFRG